MQHQIIALGEPIKIDKINAIISNTYYDDPNRIEIVYILPGSNKATVTHAIFEEGKWNISQGAGGYADNYSRCTEFVAKARTLPSNDFIY